MTAKLLEALLDLHKNKSSGVLRIERNLEKKQLVLNKGQLVFAESNLPEEHLVRIMVKLGILPQIKVKEISSLMKSGKTSEESVFAASGLEVQDVEKGRREQAALLPGRRTGSIPHPFKPFDTRTARPFHAPCCFETSYSNAAQLSSGDLFHSERLPGACHGLSSEQYRILYPFAAERTHAFERSGSHYSAF
jgi:hypothetical protein